MVRKYNRQKNKNVKNSVKEENSVRITKQPYGTEICATSPRVHFFATSGKKQENHTHVNPDNTSRTNNWLIYFQLKWNFLLPNTSWVGQTRIETSVAPMRYCE